MSHMKRCDGLMVQMVHNVAQPDLEEAIEDMINEENNVNYWPGWTWIGHREVRRVRSSET